MKRVKHLLEAKGSAVYSVGPQQPVLDALRQMAERHIGALLVTRGDELVGVVSERDYARKVILLGRSSADTPVAQIMSTPVITVHPDDTVHDCMSLMTEKRVRHLAVVVDGRVIGVVSIGDLVKAVMEEQQHQIEDLERFIHG
jgi:CBS domain-containing protein